MDEEAGLLKAVLEAPDDDGPRLAYALWSERQGDPAATARGELIRGQIALALRDPEEVRTGRAFGEQQRITDLVARYGQGWAGALAGWVKAFRFVRGFVGWVEITARGFLDHGDAIRALAPVQHLDLVGVRDVDEALWDSPSLSGIRSIAMDAGGLHDLHVQLLAGSPQLAGLRWLSMADNHLTLSAAEALAASPHLGELRFVELRGNPTDPVEQLGYDSGIVVAASMPKEGKDLEARFGRREWLHREVVHGRFDP